MLSFPPVHEGVKNGWFWGQNQVTMAGSPREPGINVETLFSRSERILCSVRVPGILLKMVAESGYEGDIHHKLVTKVRFDRAQDFNIKLFHLFTYTPLPPPSPPGSFLNMFLSGGELQEKSFFGIAQVWQKLNTYFGTPCSNRIFFLIWSCFIMPLSLPHAS